MHEVILFHLPPSPRAHSSCYKMSSIRSEFHLAHEVPRTNDPKLVASILESPLRSDAFWIKNSKIVWIFLLSSDAAWLQFLNISLQDMLVCFQNVFFVIW